MKIDDSTFATPAGQQILKLAAFAVTSPTFESIWQEVSQLALKASGAPAPPAGHLARAVKLLEEVLTTLYLVGHTQKIGVAVPPLPESFTDALRLSMAHIAVAVQKQGWITGVDAPGPVIPTEQQDRITQLVTGGLIGRVGHTITEDDIPSRVSADDPARFE